MCGVLGRQWCISPLLYDTGLYEVRDGVQSVILCLIPFLDLTGFSIVANVYFLVVPDGLSVKSDTSTTGNTSSSASTVPSGN